MTKRTHLYFLLGTILVLVPIYNFFGWIYIWNTHQNLSQFKKVVVFHEKIWLGIISDATTSTLISLFFGLISSVLLFLAMLPELKIVGKNKSRYFKIQATVFVISVIFTTWLLWTMM
jgi:hypothetical protein